MYRKKKVSSKTINTFVQSSKQQQTYGFTISLEETFGLISLFCIHIRDRSFAWSDLCDHIDILLALCADV